MDFRVGLEGGYRVGHDHDEEFSRVGVKNLMMGRFSGEQMKGQEVNGSRSCQPQISSQPLLSGSVYVRYTKSVHLV